MYCKNCGTELPINAKFCLNCGDKTDFKEKVVDTKIPEINTILSKEIPLENSSITTPIISKKRIGFYLGWVVLHLTLLLVFSSGAFKSTNSNDGIKDFWPLDGFSKYLSSRAYANYYDISEFLVYTIFPLIFLVIFGLSKDNKNSNTTGVQENPSLKY